jgi:U3 small nucleolar RNA-associated protein 20
MLNARSSIQNEAVTLLDTIYPSLRNSLLSHSHPLRLNCLRLLACQSVKMLPSELEVVQRCLQGEEATLDVHGVRERVLRIGKVGLAVKDGDRISADLCARWLLCKFHAVVVGLHSSLNCFAQLNSKSTYALFGRLLPKP